MYAWSIGGRSSGPAASRQRGESFHRLQFAAEYTLELVPLPCWEHLEPEQYGDQEPASSRADGGRAPFGVELAAGSNMSIPEHLRRFPTAASIHSLATKLRLPNSPGMQDWPWEVADPGRLDEFLAAYEQGDLTEDERFTLMEIMLQSFEDLGPGLASEPRWHRVLDLLDIHFELHACSIWYWSDLENERREDQWSVTPFLRRLLARHQSHFQW